MIARRRQERCRLLPIPPTAHRHHARWCSGSLPPARNRRRPSCAVRPAGSEPPGPKAGTMHPAPDRAPKPAADPFVRPILQLAAPIAIDQRIDDKAGTFGDFAHYSVEMADRPNHRPVMLDRLDILKLREARLGDRLQRFAGRIRHEVDMKPDHELT